MIGKTSTLYYSEKSSGETRISQRPTPRVCVKSYHFANFSRKLHENERTCTVGVCVEEKGGGLWRPS